VDIVHGDLHGRNKRRKNEPGGRACSKQGLATTGARSERKARSRHPVPRVATLLSTLDFDRPFFYSLYKHLFVFRIILLFSSCQVRVRAPTHTDE
jgi:hypothetical protein